MKKWYAEDVAILGLWPRMKMACLMDTEYRLVRYAATRDVTLMTIETIPANIADISGASTEMVGWFWDVFPDVPIAVAKYIK